MTKDPEVSVNIGYNLQFYLPASKAAELVKIMAHATFVEYSDYSVGGYTSHSTTPKEIRISNSLQPIQTSIEEAAVLDMPLYQYLEEKGFNPR